jgi:hypothetical protein
MITRSRPQIPQGPAPQRIQPVTGRKPTRPLRAGEPRCTSVWPTCQAPTGTGAPQPREHTPGATADHRRTDRRTEAGAAAGEPPMNTWTASTGQTGLSIAHMRSPPGWAEPGQRPEFDEFTIVLQETLGREDPPRPAGGTSRPRSAYQTGPMGYSTPGASGAGCTSPSACRFHSCHNPPGMTNPDQAHELHAPSGYDRALGRGQLRTESVRVRSSLRLRFPCCLSRSGPWTSRQGRGCCRTDPLRPPPGPRECRRARSPAGRRPPARPRLHRRPR